jgi:hypothetical protein
MRRLPTVLAVAAALGLATGAGAATTSDEKQELVKARDQLAAKAATTKGAAQQGYELERRHVDALIDALEHGRPVSPADVQRAVDDARTGP